MPRTGPDYVTLDISNCSTEETDIISRLVEESLEDVAVYIMSMLDEQSVRVAEQFSDTWKNVITYGSIWKKLIQKKIAKDKHWASVARHKKYKFLESTETVEPADYRRNFHIVQKDVKRVCWNWKVNFAMDQSIRTRERPRCLHFDEERIAVGYNSGTVLVYARSKFSDQHTLEGHSSGISCVQVQNFTVVSGSKDGTIRVWDVRTQLTTKILQLHTLKIIELKLFNNLIISSSDDKNTGLWLMNSFSDIFLNRQVRSHPDRINCFAADSQYIICGFESSMVQVWDMTTAVGNQRNMNLDRIYLGHEKPVTCLTFTKSIVISGGLDLYLQLWHVTNINHQTKILKPSGKVIDIHLNAERLVYVLQNGFVKISTIGTQNDREEKDISYNLPILPRRSACTFAKADEFQIMFASSTKKINIKTYYHFSIFKRKYLVGFMVFIYILTLLIFVLLMVLLPRIMH